MLSQSFSTRCPGTLPVYCTCLVTISTDEFAIVVGQFFQFDHFLVDQFREAAGFVEHVGNAAAHAGGEVAAGFAQE